MRVPSIGLPLDERLIIREGYRWAERMLRDYQDPPSLADNVAKALTSARQALLELYRTLIRG
ncbi:MAG: hypothetical protein JWP26_2772 [Devosia sp.]|uniref:hypothetical protein n=1 Tax=Devosia sp. TaxID=1871048 RepID=UPI002623CF6C|nr:hypothetical protein [Devosia sp.]MDB5536928.1 hypothetical protein [Devosia sp.]MDB5587802.1 hypothetical protein [Devosia sp.]